jgi:DNA-directed RNA polymerase specialized sigma24 family protein
MTGEPSCYPDHPGHLGITEANRETSRSAANKVAPAPKSQRDKVRAALLEVYLEGRSSDQIAEAIDVIRYSVRPRISELVAAGKVEATTERVKNSDGNSVVVWRAVQ